MKDVQIQEGITTHLNVSLNPDLSKELKLDSKIEEVYLSKFSEETKNQLIKLKEQNPDKYYRFLMDKYLSIASEGTLERSEQDEINLIEAELQNLSIQFQQADKINKARIEIQ